MKYLLLMSILASLAGCAGNSANPAPQLNAETAAMKLQEASFAIQQQQFERAMDLAKSSVRFDPNNAKAHSVIGLLYQRQGLGNEAETYFSKAVNLSPNDPAIRNNYGKYLCAERKFGAAEDNFIIAAQARDNQSPDIALTNAGLCALRANEKVRAKDFFSKAVQLNAAQTIALYQLALLSQQNADAVTASGFLQHYLSHKSHSAKTLALSAAIEADLGNVDSQNLLLKQLVREFPDSPEATQADFQLKSRAIQKDSSYRTPVETAAADTYQTYPEYADPIAPKLTPITTQETPVFSEPASTEDNSASWILARDPSRYTIQIYTAGQRSNLIDIANQMPALIGEPASFGFVHKGQKKYTLIGGDFENASDARAALISLPETIKQYQPWIRRFDSIQRVVSTKGTH